MKEPDAKLIAVFAVFSILVSLPSIVTFVRIHEIYTQTSTRHETLDSVLFLREQLGLTLADLKVTDVKNLPEGLYVTVEEQYHGLRIDRNIHKDLDRVYTVFLDRRTGRFNIVDEKKR